MKKLGIIDYGAGNLQSVRNTFLAAGQDAILVSQASDLEGLTHLVLPGVGAFGDCSRALHEQGLADALRAWIAADRPFLGICIGYQILFEGSEESPEAAGLGIFKGQVTKFRTQELKVPHMGWNNLNISDHSDVIWQDMEESPHFYFVHSYYPTPEDQSLVSSRCEYGEEFAASIRRGRLVATQFHPEKSQKLGIQLLKNFLEI